MHQAVSQACGVPVTPDTGADELARLCRRHGVNRPADAGAGALVTALYEALVEKHTV